MAAAVQPAKYDCRGRRGANYSRKQNAQKELGVQALTVCDDIQQLDRGPGGLDSELESVWRLMLFDSA